MKIILQKTPDLTAILLQEDGAVLASATGKDNFDAIGRLVVENQQVFSISSIERKGEGLIIPDVNFKERLARYWEEARTAKVPFEILHTQELAEGVIATSDTMDEYDVYFDPEHWEFTHPEIWDEPQSTPSTKKYKFEVLPGMGCIPPVKGFGKAESFAKRHLKPKNPLTVWYSPTPDPRKTS